MSKIKKGISNFLHDFKEFVMRGNVMDMAVAVIIGASFQGIVSSLVNNIISPLLGIFTQMNFDELKWEIGKAEGTGKAMLTIGYGSFITAVINFLIMALVIFLMLRFFEKVQTLTKKEKPEEEMKEKSCPYCKTEISVEASRCPHCTSIIDEKLYAEQTLNIGLEKENEECKDV